MRRYALRAALAVLVLTATGVDAQAQDGAKRVLFLYDEERTLPGLSVLDQSIRAAFTAGLHSNVEFFSESMNLSQFVGDDYDLVLRDHYARKYRDQRLDLVVAMMGPALQFLFRHSATAFPGVPVVFCGADAADFARTVLPRHITGVLLRREFAPTLEIALQLQPDVKNVTVVGGTSAFDRHLLEQARHEFQPFESQVSMNYLTDLSMDDILASVSQLPEKSLVLFLTLFRDGAGRSHVPHDVAARISAAANAPVYIFVDQYLGRGGVGGQLYSLDLHGRSAAELGLRVLAGEPPSSIAVTEPSSSATMFDARELLRWGLDERRLPPGSVIRFREPGLWDRYRHYVVPALVLLVAQTMLIAGLLVNRRLRRRVEGELRRSYEETRRLTRRMLSAQENERAHFAREVHDDISQQMALLHNELQMLLGTTDAGPVRGELGEIAKRAEQVTRGLHDLSHRLHPAYLRFVGLTAAIERLRRELSTGETQIAFSHEDVPASLPPETKVCLFRVAQEALGNALRHSTGSRVSVRLQGTPSEIVMVVDDNGRGFDVRDAPRGLGLISMRERVEQIGGTLHLDSTTERGTRLVVRIPWSEEAAAEAQAV